MDEKIANIEKLISNSQIIPLITNKDYEVLELLCITIVKSGCKIIEFGIRNEN